MFIVKNKSISKEKFMKIAFFEGKNFLYQLKVNYPKNSNDLLNIMLFAKKEVYEIWQLLIDRKKLAESTNLKTINFNYSKPYFEIRNLLKKC